MSRHQGERRESAGPESFQKSRQRYQGEGPIPTGLNSTRAGDWVQGVLDRAKLSDGVEEGTLRESWGKIAGSFVSEQTEVLSLKRGVLVLRVLQPAMRFHLEQSRGLLLQRLQEDLGAEVVREVRMVSG